MIRSAAVGPKCPPMLLGHAGAEGGDFSALPQGHWQRVAVNRSISSAVVSLRPTSEHTPYVFP